MMSNFRFVLIFLICFGVSQSYERLYTNGLSCNPVHRIEQKCNHGGGRCSETVCRQYCNDNVACTHYRSSVLGECEIFRDCSQTNWRAHDAKTYRKIGASPTPRPTDAPTPRPTPRPTPSPSFPTNHGYELISSNGLSCQGTHMIEAKCNHGGGSCSESTCRQHCSPNEACAFFRSSVLGECQIFHDCSLTSWRAHDARTYRKIGAVLPTPRPTDAPTPTPQPTDSPTNEPTPAPTPLPSPSPTPQPTNGPTDSTSLPPTPSPSPAPTSSPTNEPTPSVTDNSAYVLISSNGLSCQGVHMIEAKCSHGGGSCSENTCRQYCDQNSACSHFRSSVLGECQIFLDCLLTSWRAHDANTYRKIESMTTSLPSPSPTSAPTDSPTPSPSFADNSAYVLISSNGLSCQGVDMIEAKCSHGDGSCSEDTCRQYCDQNAACSHFRSSVLGECQIFHDCSLTSWRAHDANTYRKIGCALNGSWKPSGYNYSLNVREGVVAVSPSHGPGTGSLNDDNTVHWVWHNLQREYTGTFSNDCQVITWNNGATWLRSSSVFPTKAPITGEPTDSPTGLPAESPSLAPTDLPLPSPTVRPTLQPTSLPTDSPSLVPTDLPSPSPSARPTLQPTTSPTTLPTARPTVATPTGAPSEVPSTIPTINPSMMPTATCRSFVLDCEIKSAFEGKYSLEANANRKDVWVSEGRSSEIRLERLMLNHGQTWVFLSMNHGLLIAKQSEEDFRLVEEWTYDLSGSVYCSAECSGTYLPSKMPTMAPRYEIEVEHHLSGIGTAEWQLYQVESLYVEALAFIFDVPQSEIAVKSVQPIAQPVSRRMLQKMPSPTSMIMVRSAVSFTDYKRFQEFRDILLSVKGGASLNSLFNFLLTDKESELDNLNVRHMGIESDFDLISYFTSAAPTAAPISHGGDAMNVSTTDGGDNSYFYLTIGFAAVIAFLLVLAVWKSGFRKREKGVDFKNYVDEVVNIALDRQSNREILRSVALQKKCQSAASVFVSEHEFTPFEGCGTLPGFGVNTGYVGEPDLERQMTNECTTSVKMSPSLKHFGTFGTGLSAISESDTDLTVYEMDTFQPDGENTLTLPA